MVDVDCSLTEVSWLFIVEMEFELVNGNVVSVDVVVVDVDAVIVFFTGHELV